MERESPITALEAVTDDAVNSAVKYGLAEPGQRILILAGTPFGAPGAANLLRLAHAPAATSNGNEFALAMSEAKTPAARKAVLDSGDWLTAAQIAELADMLALAR